MWLGYKFHFTIHTLSTVKQTRQMSANFCRNAPGPTCVVCVCLQFFDCGLNLMGKMPLKIYALVENTTNWCTHILSSIHSRIARTIQARNQRRGRERKTANGSLNICTSNACTFYTKRLLFRFAFNVYILSHTHIHVCNRQEQKQKQKMCDPVFI